MRLITKVLITTLVLALMTGCGGKPKPKNYNPVSHQVTFIESTSSAEIMLRARGIGESIGAASADARAAAIWFALNGGDNPILQTPAEKNSFSAVSQDVYKNSMKYIAYDSGIKGKKKSGGKYQVDHVLRVNIAMLKEDLIQKEIIKATEDVLGDFDLPKIAVIANNTKDDDAKHGVGVISEYLHDRDFEVERLAGGSVDKVFLKIAQNISVDPMAAEMYANALASGSDIYITVDVSKGKRKISGNEVRKASVAIHAYYTANNKEIGATTGHSEERSLSTYAPVVAEAANDAANKLLNQIKKSWKKEAKKGKYYKVIVTTPDDMVRQVDTPLYKALKSTCKKVTPNKSINNIFDYTLQCKEITNFKELEMEISANYNGPGQVFRDAAKGAFIVIKIANSESDEIVIE